MESGQSGQAACRRWRAVLQATHIEPPEIEFVVRFVKFGTETRPAQQCEAKVLAKTKPGALRICKSQVKRADRFVVVSQQVRLKVSA
jgi:hypothetical protein